MAYANLSQKYLIKKLGSWNKVMEYRADALLGNESPHLQTFKQFNDDVKVQYAVSDSQGRIREMFKGYYSEFMMVHEEGKSIAVQKSTVMDAEGEESIREKTTDLRTLFSICETSSGIFLLCARGSLGCSLQKQQQYFRSCNQIHTGMVV